MHSNGTYPVYLTKSQYGVISTISLKPGRKGKVKGDMYKTIKQHYYHKTARDLKQDHLFNSR